MLSPTTKALRHGLAAAATTLGLLAASSAAFAQSPPPPANPPAGCAKDTDCKGNRVCSAGQCIESAPSPEAGGPPPGAPGAKGSYYDYKVQVAQDPRLIKDWQEGDPIPEGYVKTTRVRGGLIGAGAGLLGGFWIISIITGAIIYTGESACQSLGGPTSVTTADGDSATVCGHNHWGLFIPVVGPFIDIGTTNKQTRNAIGVTFDILDGVIQTGGLAMILAGALAPKTVLVRAAGVEIKPVPIVAQNQMGFGFQGSF
jgi:hypothetical protein